MYLSITFITMITFHTSKPLTFENFFFEITHYANAALVVTWLADVFFPDKISHPLLDAMIAFFVFIIDLIQKRKIVEIGFDRENNYLHFYSKGYFTKLKKMKTPFDNMCVEKDKKFPSKMVFFRAKNYTLYIKKDKKEVFKVDMTEDGFTEQTMDALVTQFEQTGIPII